MKFIFIFIYLLYLPLQLFSKDIKIRYQINISIYELDILDLDTFKDVIEKGLKVMDMTAFTLSEENKLPIIIFDMNTKGNLLKLVSGEKIGTVVDN